jgi:hypothetical protein
MARPTCVVEVAMIDDHPEWVLGSQFNVYVDGVGNEVD